MADDNGRAETSFTIRGGIHSMSLIQKYRYQVKALEHADFQVETGRVAALLEWMELQPEIREIMDYLRRMGCGKELTSQAGWQTPPPARTNEEVAAVGLCIMEECKNSGHKLCQIAMGWGIWEHGSNLGVDCHSAKALREYVYPFLNYVLRRLPTEESPTVPTQMSRQPSVVQNIQIEKNEGMVGHINQSSVQVHNFTSIHQTLKQMGVPQSERNELENIMDALERADAKEKLSLIERAKRWIVKNEPFLGASVSLVRKALGLGDPTAH